MIEMINFGAESGHPVISGLEEIVALIIELLGITF